MPFDLREAITPDVLDLIQDSVMLRDLDGRVVYWNNAAAKLYGWTAEQASGKNAQRLLNTRHDEPAETLEGKLLAENRWHGRLLRTTASGAELVLDARWSLRRDANDNPVAVFEISRDITARTRTALTAEDRERRYRNLFETPAAAFFELDFMSVGALAAELHKSGVTDLAVHLREHPEIARQMMRVTRVIEVNDRAIELFSPGRKQDLFGGVDVFWPDDSTPVYAEGVVAAVTGQTNFVRETRLRTVQGIEFDAEFAVHFDPENVSSGLVTIGVVDITERNRARAASEHAEFMYRNLFHGMAVPFFRIDSTGITAMFTQLRDAGVTDLAAHMAAHPEFVLAAKDASIVVEANEPAVRLFGAAQMSELLGSLGRLMAPGWEYGFRNSLVAGFARQPGYQSETKLRRLDGREIDVMLFVIATPPMREKGIVLIGLIDIAEQVAARSALQRMQADLAHASRVSMLGELTASIAHEVNQPLTAITTNAEAGLRWLGRDDLDVGEIRTLMGRVVVDARRAADIVQRVRGMATRRSSEMALIALNDVVEETALFLRHELQAHNVALALELASNLPGVSADRIQMQQVIVNLAVNAIQAMVGVVADQRRLTIATGIADARHVFLRVEDSGPGIASDCMPRLFERFYSTKSGGMGMGLPICQSIVEAHGGHIHAANNSGVGACFSFTVPMAGDQA